MWSNSNPVEFSVSTTGTGTGAVVSQSRLGATSGFATGFFTDFGIGLYAGDDFVVPASSRIARISTDLFNVGALATPATGV